MDAVRMTFARRGSRGNAASCLPMEVNCNTVTNIDKTVKINSFRQENGYDFCE